MIGAKLGPLFSAQAQPSAPEAGRASRSAAGNADDAARATGPRNGLTGRDDRPGGPHRERNGQPAREPASEHAERAGRADSMDRRERAGRTGGREDADAFERLVDREGPQSFDTAHAPGGDASVTSSAPPAEPARDPAGPGAGAAPEALPSQLLSMLSTLALAGTPAPAGSVTPGSASGIPATAMASTAAAMPPVDAVRLTPTPAALALPNAAATPAGDAAALAALVPQHAENATTDDGATTLPAPEGRSDAAPFSVPGTIASTPLPRTAAVPVLATLALPADPQAGFDDGFGSRIVWMAEQRLGHADIRITPEHLGTIDVRVQLDGSKVSAEFYSAQPEVRQALEASFGRLRDLLGQHGLQLAHADVGQQRSGRGDTHAPGTASDRTDAEPSTVAPAVIRSQRLLDEIA